MRRPSELKQGKQRKETGSEVELEQQQVEEEDLPVVVVVTGVDDEQQVAWRRGRSCRSRRRWIGEEEEQPSSSSVLEARHHACLAVAAAGGGEGALGIRDRSARPGSIWRAGQAKKPRPDLVHLHFAPSPFLLSAQDDPSIFR